MIKEDMIIYQSAYMHLNVFLCSQEHKKIIHLFYCLCLTT